MSHGDLVITSSDEDSPHHLEHFPLDQSESSTTTPYRRTNRALPQQPLQPSLQYHFSHHHQQSNKIKMTPPLDPFPSSNITHLELLTSSLPPSQLHTHTSKSFIPPLPPSAHILSPRDDSMIPFLRPSAQRIRNYHHLHSNILHDSPKQRRVGSTMAHYTPTLEPIPNSLNSLPDSSNTTYTLINSHTGLTSLTDLDQQPLPQFDPLPDPLLPPLSLPNSHSGSSQPSSITPPEIIFTQGLEKHLQKNQNCEENIHHQATSHHLHHHHHHLHHHHHHHHLTQNSQCNHTSSHHDNDDHDPMAPLSTYAPSIVSSSGYTWNSAATTMMSLSHFGKFIGSSAHSPPWYSMRHITTGFRINYTFIDAWKSLFELHNETAGIWSHIFGFIIFIVLFIYRYNTILFGIEDRFLFWCYIMYYFGSAICMLCSFSFHLFCCCGEDTHNRLYGLDMSAINAMIIGQMMHPIYLMWSCDTETNLGFWYSMYALVFGLILIGIQQSEYCLQERFFNFRIGAILFYSTSALFAFFHFYPYSTTEQWPMVFNPIAITFTFYGFGVFVWIAKFPEVLAPGVFDLGLSSHGIWHTCILIGSLYTEQGFMYVLERIVENNWCENSPLLLQKATSALMTIGMDNGISLATDTIAATTTTTTNAAVSVATAVVTGL